MIDLDKIKADNAERRTMKERASDGPWAIKYSSNVAQVVYGKDRKILVFDTVSDFPAKETDVQLIAFARNDNAEDTIDALVAEVERLRAILTSPCEHCDEGGPMEIFCGWCGTYRHWKGETEHD